MDFPISLELQTFLRIKKAVRALPVLTLTCASVPPYVSIGERADFFKELSCYCDWAVTGVLRLHDICLAIIDVETYSALCWIQACSFVLHLPMAVGQECQVKYKVRVIKL